jgi:hypothetical protein
METLGWTFVGAGIGFLAAGGLVYFMRWRQRHQFDRFLHQVRKMGTEEALRLAEQGKESRRIEREKEGGREVSELSFRDKDGVMNTVRIIIDPDLEVPEEDKKMIKAIMAGERAPDYQCGSINDLLSGCKIEEQAMERVQEFVFSANAVRNMREDGLEPDEVVTRMLKASGRMPE